MASAVMGVQRVRAVSGELTSSWLARLAGAYALSDQDLLRGILAGPSTPEISGAPLAGRELFLNGPARLGVARFTGVSAGQLGALLPAFALGHERLTDQAAVARAAWYTARRSWVSACLACTAGSGSGWRPVRVYPGPAGHICPRHQRWLLAGSRRSPALDLARLPDVLEAHHLHTTVVQHYPRADAVVGHAAAVVWSWQTQGWAREAVWARRAGHLADLMGCEAAVVAAHPLITYPEMVAVARLLGCPSGQRRFAAVAAAHGLRAATDALHTALARCTGRPWLADWLAACSRLAPPRQDSAADPLRCWLRALVHPDVPGRLGLWAVPQAARWPVRYTDRSRFLCSVPARRIAEQARDLALTGGWQPPAAPCLPTGSQGTGR